MYCVVFKVENFDWHSNKYAQLTGYKLIVLTLYNPRKIGFDLNIQSWFEYELLYFLKHLLNMSTHPATDTKVERLLEGINSGEFAIPLFQRGFEWTPNKVKDLLTSIIENYFSGLLLFWELDRNKVTNKELQPLWGTNMKNEVNFAVLDGQQRLSSLYYALYNPSKVFPNKQSYYLFYVDLKKCKEGNLEESISYEYGIKHTSTEELKKRKNNIVSTGKFPIALLSDKDFLQNDLKSWIREYVKDLLKGSETEGSNFGEADFDTVYDTVTEIQDYLSRILEYKFTTHVLDKKNDIRDVCLMFARLNQKGLKLSVFDLMNAFLYREGIALRQSFEEDVRGTLKKIPDVDEYLLKSIALFKREYSSPRYVYSLVPGYEDTQIVNGNREKFIPVKDSKEFVKLWQDAIKFGEIARKRIQNVSDKCFGAIKAEFIPNTTILPVLASALKEFREHRSSYLIEDQFDRVLSKWYWTAVFSQDYSGSSDTVMSKDYRELKNWIITGDVSSVEKVISDRGTKILAELKLSNEKKGSSIYNAIISMIAINKAEDFFERILPGSGDYKGSAINDHHIFPAKVKGLNPKSSNSYMKTKDNILNRTLLLDSTNDSINNDRPSVYLDKLLTEKFGGENERLSKLMETHFVSSEALQHLRNDEYDLFIQSREMTLMNAIRKLIT